jgi:hypothetical protein
VSADIAAIVHDAENWRDNRDAIVRAALQALAQSGGSLDFLTVQFALAAAFNEAARHEMTRQGSSIAWAVLKRNAERLSAP